MTTEVELLLLLICLQAMAVAAVTAVWGLRVAMVVSAGLVAVSSAVWSRYAGRTTPSTDDASDS